MWAGLELIYWGMTGFGVILTGLSLFVGGDEADADADLDADTEGGLSFSALPFASIRFWMFFADTFGLTGLLLSFLGLAPQVVFALASVVGTTLGYAGFSLFRHLQREVVTADTTLHVLRGQEGRVLLPIRGASIGKIVVERMSGRVELLARFDAPGDLERGAPVVVVAVQDGVAEVAPIQQLP